MPMKMTEDFHKVLRYAHRWGVNVCIVEHLSEMPHEGSDWFKSPISFGGIEWDKQRIWMLDGEGPYPHFYGPEVRPHVFLHELAHCVAFEDPEAISEPYSEMLAFEYFSTRWLRLSGWTRWMRDYNIDRDEGRTTVSWGAVGTRERHEWLEQSLDVARHYGILNKDGTPTFRRAHGEHL